MKRPVAFLLLAAVLAVGILPALPGCLRGQVPDFLGGDSSGTATAGLFLGAFNESLIQERTFVDGTAVKTVTYHTGDLARTPVFIDFNGDGKVDPVVAYGPEREGIQQAVLQILLSEGDVGNVEYLSLTLDAKRDWYFLSDVAVADIDGDGALDLVAATRPGVLYLHHPTGLPTRVLRDWGSPDPALEYLEGSTVLITNDELQVILTQALGPHVNLDDYDVEVTQGYTRVATADFNNDGHEDIAASRSLNIRLTPAQGKNVAPLEIVEGTIQVFLNPGGAVDGAGWQLVAIGQHERHTRLDRDGARGLIPYDIDGDGDFDLVSAAYSDNNAQVSWFENPLVGGGDINAVWTPWRIGSLRGTFSIDVADVTGDQLPDVVGTGSTQRQLVVFVQPSPGAWPDGGPRREYDWDTAAIVTFENYEPLDVKAIDIDNDDVLELVVSGTEGAVRYFERDANPTDPWTGNVILNFDPPGRVGLIGYGDLDGDGDLDLVTALDDESVENDNADRVSWIRNELLTGP